MEAQAEKMLNVTLLPPREKHPTIFQWFDNLKEGESFILHNDHDPKPLYYQLLGERGKIFSWDYLQQGPDVFEIRITKLNKSRNAAQSSDEKFLDVTKLAPPVKHPTIFQWFDNLKEGESFILHNDHDPKPLYYQLMGERGEIFSWDYLKQGPDVFEIRIGKLILNNNENKETVGSISAQDYRKAEVFKKLGIDFCCNGDKTLKEAASEVGITEADIRKALSEAESTPSTGPELNYNQWDLDFLADYIRQTHHRYVRDKAEAIAGVADKVAKVHGDHHPELLELAPRVQSMLNDFMYHMDKEEKNLFPCIKKLAAIERHEASKNEITCSVKDTIHQLEEEHDHTGDDLKHFRELTKDYELPSDACNAYTYLFEALKEFEDDTFRHVHIENNILFPRAIQLEREINAK